jgi:hypothetical protein
MALPSLAPSVLSVGRDNTAFCIFEIAGLHSGLNVTADFTYARLHGAHSRLGA